MRRIIIRSKNSIATVYDWIAGILLQIFSTTPRNIPPTIAPGIDPIPPITAAVNAFIPGIDPSVGSTEGICIR